MVVPAVTAPSLPLEDVWLDLEQAPPLTTTTEISERVQSILTQFDVTADLATETHLYAMPEINSDWNIGLIVGTSGSGKTTMLRRFGKFEQHDWLDHICVADHLSNPVDSLTGVGLNSVPSWLRPYHALSTGEQHRADLAWTLDSGGGIVDEFSSVVDRNVARSSAHAVRRYIAAHGGQFVFASCHRDVIAWLGPDWIVDLDRGRYSLRPRECLQRQPLTMVIRRVKRQSWRLFAKHHYLSGDLHGFAVCYGAFIDAQFVGFCAVLPFPNGHLRGAWREHRTVVLPEWQGFGIGPRLADAVAGIEAGKGHLMYTKVAHPSLIRHRDASPLWERLRGSQNRTGTKSSWDHWKENVDRQTASHRYIGPALIMNSVLSREGTA